MTFIHRDSSENVEPDRANKTTGEWQSHVSSQCPFFAIVLQSQFDKWCETTFLHYAGIETRRASFNGRIEEKTSIDWAHGSPFSPLWMALWRESSARPTMFALRVLSKGKENDSFSIFLSFPSSTLDNAVSKWSRAREKANLSLKLRSVSSCDIVQRHFPAGEMRNCSISSRTRLTELRRERNRQGIWSSSAETRTYQGIRCDTSPDGTPWSSCRLSRCWRHSSFISPSLSPSFSSLAETSVRLRLDLIRLKSNPDASLNAIDFVHWPSRTSTRHFLDSWSHSHHLWSRPRCCPHPRPRPRGRSTQVTTEEGQTTDARSSLITRVSSRGHWQRGNVFQTSADEKRFFIHDFHIYRNSISLSRPVSLLNWTISAQFFLPCARHSGGGRNNASSLLNPRPVSRSNRFTHLHWPLPVLRFVMISIISTFLCRSQRASTSTAHECRLHAFVSSGWSISSSERKLSNRMLNPMETILVVWHVSILRGETRVWSVFDFTDQCSLHNEYRHRPFFAHFLGWNSRQHQLEGKKHLNRHSIEQDVSQLYLAGLNQRTGSNIVTNEQGFVRNLSFDWSAVSIWIEQLIDFRLDFIESVSLDSPKTDRPDAFQYLLMYQFRSSERPSRHAQSIQLFVSRTRLSKSSNFANWQWRNEHLRA